MDWRGQGLSDKPPASGYTQTLLANDIKAVLEELKVKNVVMVGSSLGGYPLNSYLNVYGLNHHGVKVKGVVYVAAIPDSFSLSFITPAAHAAIGESLTATTPDQFTQGTQSFVTLSTLLPQPPGLNDFYLAQDLLTPAASRQAILEAVRYPP